jgi:hypothetical protein
MFTLLFLAKFQQLKLAEFILFAMQNPGYIRAMGIDDDE